MFNIIVVDSRETDACMQVDMKSFILKNNPVTKSYRGEGWNC